MPEIFNEGFNVAHVRVLNVLLGACILVAWTRVSLDITSDKNPSVDAIRAEFKNFLTYLFTFFVFQLALIVGFMLLIIPGIYVAVTYNWFAYLIAEKHYGAKESLKQSARLVDGARWQILKFFFAIVGLNILGLLALVVGLFVTVPMSMIAGALIYRALALRATSKAAAPLTEAPIAATPVA
jgi:uncharacterized membrane protein